MVDEEGGGCPLGLTNIGRGLDVILDLQIDYLLPLSLSWMFT